MNDRELLELAAKAAGFVIGFSKTSPEQGRPYVWNDEKKKGRWWNPIEDDGDALRLAIRLGMSLSTNLTNRFVTVNNESEFYDESKFGGVSDPDGTMRLAIVRAAAEIGRQMKEGE